MEKFKFSFIGYDIREVNSFVDEMTKKYSEMLEKLKKQDIKLEDLETKANKTSVLDAEREKILNHAREEAELIIENARVNASRLVNDALIEAQKLEFKNDILKKNISSYKSKIKSMAEYQVNSIDYIDNIEK